MDQRKAQLKTLKKAYKRAKRKSLGLWKCLAVLFLIVALLAAFVLFVPLVPTLLLVSFLPIELVRSLAENIWILYLMFGVGLVLFIEAALIAKVEKKKLKKTAAYLDYRTMKLTLKAEKEATK